MRKNTEDKGFAGAVVVTVVTVGLMFLLTMALLVGVSGSGSGSDPFTALLVLACAALYMAIAAGVIVALRERWQEIQGGEEDEAKKY